MRHPAVLFALASVAACVDPLPSPPVLEVTSPSRGLVQSEAGKVMVTGKASPGSDGEAIASVTVDGKQANVGPDGTFSLVVDVPAGAMLLKTVATSTAGGKEIDARAIHVGQLRPIGSPIERALSVALSADAFAKLSAIAGPQIMALDLPSKIGTAPIATLGNSTANVKVSLTKLTFGDVKVTLTPTDNGLVFSAQVSKLAVTAKAAYDIVITDGTVNVNVTADSLVVGGTLQVLPNGNMGFTTKLASPTIKPTNLKLSASGLVGSILSLLQDNLGSMVTDLMQSAASKGLEPGMNAAFGALAGPQKFNILGRDITVEGSPSDVKFSRAGAQFTMNLGVKIGGSESSKGFIFNPNGNPVMNMGTGVQLAIADDLLNEMLAEVHALNILNMTYDHDYGVFDRMDFKLAMPPMISANAGGSMRLVLGDMLASFSDNGTAVISAAVNASVDLKVEAGTKANEIGIKFDNIDAVVNVVNGGELMSGDLEEAAKQGINLQLDSLEKFLVTIPVPTIAGISLDGFTLGTDSGYVMASGQIH